MDLAHLPTGPGIYRLRNAVNGKVYVGSSVNVRKRVRLHFLLLTTGKHVNSHLQRSFGRDGAEAFTAELVESCATTELLHCEQSHIDGNRSHDRRYGYNINPSASRQTISEETRAKLSAAGKGRKRSPETRAKMAETWRGRKHTPESRAKISAARANTSAETRALMSAAHAGKPCAWREKIAEAMRRPEVREKLRIASTGHKASLEARAKMRERMLARPPYRHTPESKEKMASLKRGKPVHPAMLEAARLANTGRKMSADDIAKRQAWRGGASPEKIAAFKGRCRAAALAREQRKRESRVAA